MRRILSNKGYRVLTAPKWSTGITLATETEPSLVLIDFDLPDIGGNALAARLRSLPELKGVPLVALVNKDQEKQVLAINCDGALCKPLSPRQLPLEIEHYLEQEIAPPSTEEQVEQLNTLLQEMTGRLEEQALQLETKERRLQEANRLRGNFLINVSRELRTPLTLISGYVTLLQSTVPMLDLDDAPLSLVEMVEGMAQGTKRMNDVVQELLRVSRIVTGDVNLAIGPVRVNTLVSTTLSDLAEQERDVIQQRELSQLPIIQADGNQIRLAIRNILIHLLNIIPENGLIVIDGQHQQDIVIISLQGVGAQIDPAEQEMLFDRLYSAGPSRAADPEEQRKQSLGFGLAIANGIIQAHNGRIWIESTGEGEQVQSTFYLLLPILA